MAVLTVYPDKNVEIYAHGDVYATVRNAEALAEDVDINTDFYLGQDYIINGSLYGVFRCGIFFDTSALPDAASILSAILSLYGKYDWSDTDFDITVLDGSVIEDTPVAADYRDLLAITASLGTFSTSGWSTSGYNAITLNADGRALINKTGVTKLALRSSREIAGTTPKLNSSTNEESIGIYGINSAEAFQPKLIITYGESPDPLARVSSIRHIFRPGFFRMQVGLGDLGFDVDIAESTVRKALDTAKEVVEAPPTAGALPTTEVGYPEILEVLGMTSKEFAKKGREISARRRVSTDFSAYKEQIEYEEWFQKQMEELRDMGWEE